MVFFVTWFSTEFRKTVFPWPGDWSNPLMILELIFIAVVMILARPLSTRSVLWDFFVSFRHIFFYNAFTLHTRWVLYLWRIYLNIYFVSHHHARFCIHMNSINPLISCSDVVQCPCLNNPAAPLVSLLKYSIKISPCTTANFHHVYLPPRARCSKSRNALNTVKNYDHWTHISGFFLLFGFSFPKTHDLHDIRGRRRLFP